jgi:tRNA(Ile2) C34 agmatinyltransferase TiaS
LAAFFGAAVLAAAGMSLSALGVFLLFPLYGALTHLRCPRCDTATTLKGVTDGHHCLHCGQRLRF